MVVAALSLSCLAVIGAALTPPLERGVAKNGAAVVAVPTAAPFAVATLEVVSPDGVGADALGTVLPAMAAAARAAAGKDATVEVTWRPASVAVIVTSPAAGADAATRSLDAALKAMRGAPPRVTPPLPTPWRGDVGHQLAGSADAAAAFKAMSGVGPAHVAVVVVGPGPDLLRRTQGLIGAPLKKDAPRARRALGPGSEDKADHVVIGAVAPAERAALEVVADLVGAHLHDDGDDVRVGFYGPAAERRQKLATLVEAPPPQALIDDVAHARRLALATPVDDPAALALVLSSDALTGDDAFAVIDALARVERDAVIAAATRLLEVLP